MSCAVEVQTAAAVTTSRQFDDAVPGRSCPLHYRYSPHSLARDANWHAETVYVVGGLYGNPFALDALQLLIARESGDVRVVFNGDFHWFDHEPQLFTAITERVLAHSAIRGNVETELAAHDDAAGCGCAYPDWVDDAVVERSNTIENALRRTALALPEQTKRITDLPMNLRVQVGEARVAIVHGDAESLAGWGFSRRTLASAAGVERARQWLDAANVDVFACTHTCEPLCMRVKSRAASSRDGVIINNGAAGMPNFRRTHHGLVTRIATRPAADSNARLYGTKIAGVHVDAMALSYNHAQWWQTFQRLWPPGSPAHLSYGARIRDGGDLPLAEATM